MRKHSSSWKLSKNDRFSKSNENRSQRFFLHLQTIARHPDAQIQCIIDFKMIWGRFGKKLKKTVSKNEHLFDFIRSWDNNNRYIPGYLRASWWATRQSKTKRITKQFVKINFFSRQVTDSKIGQLRRKSYCPGVALSKHEAKLHLELPLTCQPSR